MVDESDQDGVLAYWRRVSEELMRRESALQKVDQEIGKLMFELEKLTGAKELVRGDSRQIASAASYRSFLKRELKKKNAERHEVLEQIAKAKERKRMAQEDLRAEGLDS